MKLSTPEFRAMQSLPRRLGQQFIELPLFQRMGLNVHDREVLEIGCGSGFGAYLLNRLQPKRYLGLDVMPEQIELARKHYPQFQFLIQDAADLGQFEPQSWDVIIIFGVLHHIPDWRPVIREIARVLKRGGGLFLEEPRGLELKWFDIVFRWLHPQSDFGLQVMESYISTQGLVLASRRWTPLLTMYHFQQPE